MFGRCPVNVRSMFVTKVQLRASANGQRGGGLAWSSSECWTLEEVVEEEEEKVGTWEKTSFYNQLGQFLSTPDLGLAQAKREQTKHAFFTRRRCLGYWCYDTGGDVTHFGLERWIAADIPDKIKK